MLIRKTILFILSVTIVNFSEAQTDNTFAIKGKFWILPVFVTAVQTGIGLEYGFKDKYSISLEYELAFISYPNDYGDSIGPRMSGTYNSVICTFKKYMDWHKEYKPYLALFGHFGLEKYNFEKGYITDTITYDQIQYSYGFLVGIVIPIGRKTACDINIGPYWKLKNIHDVYTDNGAIIDDRFSQQNFGIRAEVDIVFIAKRNNGHLLSQAHY
jgi:hypothetical protein